ncbi:DUF3592 domain-containing protein [Amycolatopsis nigrescens]|uniref:DUF3592 domain-containing protein n=1 Tax=Amycolatopsis nigrescens TaxID=381445 RepID=UPI000369FBCE|nr:DUF3592 domain-containing protein [Amycolatopsis nigrescens]
MTAKSERRRRIGARFVFGIAIAITVLCVSLLFAAMSNDRAITGQRGTADAQVDSVSFDRTIIRFETPDGIVHSPANGVLYPDGLVAGDLVRIEYDAGDPELARVAGRSASLTLMPLGSTVLVTWLVAAPALWWLRRRVSGPSEPTEPTEPSEQEPQPA